MQERQHPCQSCTCGKNDGFLTVCTPRDLPLRHNRNVDDSQKLHLWQLHGFSTVWTIPSTCRCTRRARPQPHRRTALWRLPCCAQFYTVRTFSACNWTVPHSDLELNLRQQHHEQEGLLEFKLHDDKDVAPRMEWGDAKPSTPKPTTPRLLTRVTLCQQ